METLMFFGRNPDAVEIKEYVVNTFEVHPKAESFHMRVDLKTGDITCHVMFPMSGENVVED